MALILVVDDQGPIRRAFRRMLSMAGHEVLEAPSLTSATCLLEETFRAGDLLDIVLLDLNFGDEDGARLLPLIRKLHPEAAVAVVSGHIDAGRAVELSPQCHMCVPKPVGGQTLLRLVETLLQRRDQRTVESYARRMDLSQQETRALREATLGKDTKQIATALACSEATVKTYWQRIFVKTGLRTRTGVIAAAAGLDRRRRLRRSAT